MLLSAIVDSNIKNISSSASRQLVIPPRPHIPLPSSVIAAFPDLKEWQEKLKAAEIKWRAETNVAVYGNTPPV